MGSKVNAEISGMGSKVKTEISGFKEIELCMIEGVG